MSDLWTEQRQEQHDRAHAERCYRAGEDVYVECEKCEAAFRPEADETVCDDCREDAKTKVDRQCVRCGDGFTAARYTGERICPACDDTLRDVRQGSL